MKSFDLLNKILIAGAVLCMFVIPFSCTPTDDVATKTFTFVHMCDTQFGMSEYDLDVRAFEQAVKQINEIKPDFVVIAGDLVNTPSEKPFADFNRVKAGFNMPCHCAAGNHDVKTQPTHKSLKYYRETIGPDYFSFEHKGYTFIIVNTQLWQHLVPEETQKQNDWLEATLKAAHTKGNPVFIVGHIPLFIGNVNEKNSYYNIPQAERKRLLELYKSNGVVAVLTGHRHKTVINNYDGIQMVTPATTSRNFDKKPRGFRLWRVNSSTSITHESVELEAFK